MLADEHQSGAGNFILGSYILQSGAGFCRSTCESGRPSREEEVPIAPSVEELFECQSLQCVLSEESILTF